ncbi:hypothetical protein LY76DRAFT_313914 [Colletotrichum caudatum]|nr:hypothetical protein LY76DRAFT_313914 [Colletotrichum caudatum]
MLREKSRIPSFASSQMLFVVVLSNPYGLDICNALQHLNRLNPEGCGQSPPVYLKVTFLCGQFNEFPRNLGFVTSLSDQRV